MNFHIKSATESTLPLLYHFNKQMAFEEGQEALFTASYAEYSRAFLSSCPLAYGMLIYRGDDPIGFLVYQEKFATYLGRKVFYIEDVYLGQYQHDAEVFRCLLKEIINYADNGDYCRIEMRRLERYSPPSDPLILSDYYPIDKWKVWRKNLS